MFRILNSFSSCSGVDVLLQGDPVVRYFVVLFPRHGWRWLSVIFVAVPSWKYCWVVYVLFLTCRFEHLFRCVVHSLSFRRSVLGSTTAVFLDDISRDWGDVTVVLVELRWTPRRFHISPAAHCSQNIAVWNNFRKVRTSRCCSVGDQFLRFFAELVDLLRLAQVLKEGFLVLLVLELLDQLLVFVLAVLFWCSTAETGTRYSMIHGVVTDFSVTFRVARWFPRWSCVLVLWIL